MHTIHHGDCLDVLRQMPDNSVHAIVTDPPYGLSNTTPEQVADTIVRWVSGDREHLPSGRGFMGKEWDGFVPPVAVWDEAMRVLKPGGHVLAFAGTRTMDLMTLGLRLAGFDIRDSVAWLYGSGFPKSMDIGKAIDKAARGVPHGGPDPTSPNHGNYRTIKTEGKRWNGDSGQSYGAGGSAFLTSTASEKKAPQSNASHADGSQNHTLDATATKWEGWGSATKPAFEPVIMARKPFRGTLAANVLEHGTGGLNIDATRVGTEVRTERPAGGGMFRLDGCQSIEELRHLASIGAKTPTGCDARTTLARAEKSNATSEPREYAGRWPANVILDEHMAVVLDEQSGWQKDGVAVRHRGVKSEGVTGWGDMPAGTPDMGYGSGGGASRFFYVAKASKRERPDVDGIKHPTVKPLALMRWLVRLVTPPNGTVLDPFAGSGTTIEAAMLEGFDVIGIEREAEYLPLIQHRIDRAQTTQTEAPEQGAFAFKEHA